MTHGELPKDLIRGIPVRFKRSRKTHLGTSLLKCRGTLRVSVRSMPRLRFKWVFRLNHAWLVGVILYAIYPVLT